MTPSRYACSLDAKGEEGWLAFAADSSSVSWAGVGEAGYAVGGESMFAVGAAELVAGACHFAARVVERD